MRRRAMLLAGLVAVASCTDATKPTVFTIPTTARYQLTASGTLAEEVTALIKALFPAELETTALGKWTDIKQKVARGDLTRAKQALLEFTQYIEARESRLDPPPNNESVSTGVARLVLYMSLYVYNGPNSVPPPQFGTGADAVMEIATPTAPLTAQTPLLHAATDMDAGSVTTPTIVVITQNTNFFASHCEGPFSTKYCQYPIYYSYHSFPHVRFEKPVHVAMCHVPTGGNYGPLPGVDHELFVVVHDKPANPADYTPGGLPVTGEAIEILPENATFDPTHPIITCPGTAYPQVALFNVPPHPTGFLAITHAYAARAANGAMHAIGRLISPKSAYAIDNGVEHNTFLFSQFANVDTIGRPDLQLSNLALSTRSVVAGGSVTVSFTLANGGTAPSPGITRQFVLTPGVGVPGSPISLTATPSSWNGPLFPLDTHNDAVTLTIPASLAAGKYVLTSTIIASGGLPEPAPALTDNTTNTELVVTAP